MAANALHNTDPVLDVATRLAQLIKDNPEANRELAALWQAIQEERQEVEEEAHRRPRHTGSRSLRITHGWHTCASSLTS
ncbi:hypothetical protein HC928_01360 [bacterium]|nr:hypothetical protein [bacterium]